MKYAMLLERRAQSVRRKDWSTVRKLDRQIQRAERARRQQLALVQPA